MPTEVNRARTNLRPTSRPNSRPNSKQDGPIQIAIETWAKALPDCHSGVGRTIPPGAPKRYVIYEPMVLLPSGSFTSPSWKDLLAAVGEPAQLALWLEILRQVSTRAKTTLTHLAVNAGIPSHIGEEKDSSLASVAGDRGDLQEKAKGQENLLRSPVSLRLLCGYFGPSTVMGWDPMAADDFGAALWVSTKQNGIFQTWAPRWTMFSRGNVKEKARLLSFHDERAASSTTKAASRSPAPNLFHRQRPPSRLHGLWAVDLYAGIGYFAFSYARLGMRVMCWELNPWSVEGLRRGAIANGWSVRVVEGTDLHLPNEDILNSGREQIVVFLEDNARAGDRILGLRGSLGAGLRRGVVHVNCGLLPTSEPTWRMAVAIAQQSPEAWVHLHENVAADDVERRREGILARLGDHHRVEAATTGHNQTVTFDVEHVERVKTVAPGVWHCVFDVYTKRQPQL